MEAIHYIWCDMEGHMVYICKKDIKIRGIELENKIDMDYQELA